MKIKPKTYGPLEVKFRVDDALTVETEMGNSVRGGLSPAKDALSPSDLILASLASCLAISMRMAARQMSQNLGALEVSAVAIKATDLPNRFGHFEVEVRTEFTVPNDKTDELLRRTKEICTISNTIAAEIVVRLSHTPPSGT